MPFEGVVVEALGTESPRPPERHSVEAMALLCLLLLLVLLQLLSRFDHRQAAASVAVGQWVSPCEEHLWDVSAHGRLTQASLSEEDRAVSRVLEHWTLGTRQVSQAAGRGHPAPRPFPREAQSGPMAGSGSQRITQHVGVPTPSLVFFPVWNDVLIHSLLFHFPGTFVAENQGERRETDLVPVLKEATS